MGAHTPLATYKPAAQAIQAPFASHAVQLLERVAEQQRPKQTEDDPAHAVSEAQGAPTGTFTLHAPDAFGHMPLAQAAHFPAPSQAEQPRMDVGAQHVALRQALDAHAVPLAQAAPGACLGMHDPD